ncbi:MAG: cupin domain-containing protein, partial [Sedimentibacter sp.]
MKYYYEFIGQKLNLPISICMNSVDNTLFHQNSDVELIYVLKDSFVFSLNNGEYTLNTRDIAVIAPDVIHSIKKNVDSAVVLIIHINHQDQLFVNDLMKSNKYKTAIINDRT